MPVKIEIISETEKVTPITAVTLPSDNQDLVRETSDVEITPRIENLLANFDKDYEKTRKEPIDTSVKDPHTFNRSVTTVTNVTEPNAQEQEASHKRKVYQ